MDDLRPASPRPLPSRPLLPRAFWWQVFGTSLIPLVVMLVWFSLPAAWRSGWSIAAYVVALVAPILLINIFFVRSISRMRRALTACRGNLCPRCHYPFHGLAAEADRCPECGTVIDLPGIMYLWRRWSGLDAAALPDPPAKDPHTQSLHNR